MSRRLLNQSKAPQLTRQGVSPSCVYVSPDVLAQLPALSNLLDFFVARFPRTPPDVWRKRFSAGHVLNLQGQALQSDALCTATDAATRQPLYVKQHLYYYRHVEAEARIPFDEVLLYQDEHLLVVDKPHFLPVTPSGRYVQETLLVRLKNKLGLPSLSPLHRLDRDTAGLVLFAVQAHERGAYQGLFHCRVVNKTYEAIAPYKSDIALPVVRRTHLAESAIYMQMAEYEELPPNSQTEIVLLERLSQQGNIANVSNAANAEQGLARYQLKPSTGKRHQLRVHMNALGIPILNDGIYPTLTPEQHVFTGADYAKPLQLLAKAIQFTDPISGEIRAFESQRTLCG
jgi:tRNA pseudouridine32 synthase/23S rRNA pseudouridine746 synthase